LHIAGRLVVALNIHVPFFIGAGAVVAGILILTTVHSLLADAERAQAEEVSGGQHGRAVTPRPAERIVPIAANGRRDPAIATAGILVAAVDDSPVAGLVTEAAARLARHEGRTVHIVHAPEAAIGGDFAVDGEKLEAARALVQRHLDQLGAHHVAAEGQLFLHAADHGAAGRMVAGYASEVGALAIVLGAPTHGGLSAAMDASSTRELLRAARSHVLIVNPEASVLEDGVPGDDERLVPTAIDPR
jgi:nucleotide-binding universal stress UspA family protein